MPRTIEYDQTGPPDVLHVVDSPMPEPGPGEIRVKLEAFAVNRLDELMRSGLSPRPIRLPHARLGIEGAGSVDALGAEVTGVEPGDSVIITAVPDADVNGTYAEYTIVPVDRVVPRPAGLSPIEAAAVWVAYSTAYGALVEKAGMRPGDTVLITAASGSVGRAAIQIANLIGAIPIATTRTSDRSNALLDAGAAAVVATDGQDVATSVRQQTGGVGADIILDLVMGPGLNELAKAARFAGTLVTAGWLDPRPAPYPTAGPLTMHRYMSFEHTLDPVVTHRMAAFLNAGVRAGVITPVIDRVYSLEDVVDAHRQLADGGAAGKIVVTI